MNILQFTDYEIVSAPLGKETKYPDLSVKNDLHAGLSSEGLPEKIYFGYGSVENMLPYKMRESYSRERKKTTVKAAVLENDSMKAVFLTEYGCRLWSLYDKTEKRELLFKNPVLQFANLALRNAWFAGGVEWNIGYIGHSSLTCEKMFCEKVTDAETGAPVLRFYEYERIRRVVYEIDAYLNEEYRQLMIRVRIKNCHNEEIPMYWWSNMAVPETLGTRVVLDADSAFTHIYSPEAGKKKIGVIPVPYYNSTDITYSCLKRDAIDYFFRVPDDRQKYIAALDKNGDGLIQTSTRRLKGRKLFLWGMAPGGRTWQNYLTKNVNPYIEIQAGLARTQCECIPMPAGEEWEWLESYGFMQADPDKIHGKEWNEANAEVNKHLISESFMNYELARTRKSITGVKGELLQSGSGWGFLESLRREKNGEAKMIDGIEFKRSDITAEQQAWLDLLEKGDFSVPEDLSAGGYMIQKEYIPLLEKYISNGGENWFAHLHLGICFYGNGRLSEAKKEFLKSNSLKENPYALCCLGYFEQQDGNLPRAFDYLISAYRMDNNSYALAKRCFNVLLCADNYNGMIALYNEIPENLRNNGRMKYFYAKALVGVGELEKATDIINSHFEVADIREAEISLYDFWIDYCTARINAKNEYSGDDIKAYIKEHYPVPGWLNFNMHED